MNKVKKEFVGQKSKFNAKIVNLYVDHNNSQSDNTKTKGLKDLLRAVRKRQIINVLEKIEDVKFFYISMTDMMHSLLIESLLTGENREGEAPQRYKNVIKLVESWSKE